MANGVSDEQVVIRAATLHRRLAIKHLNERGVAATRATLGKELKKTVSVFYGQTADGTAVRIVTVTDSSYYKYLTEAGQELLLPGEELGSRNTNWYDEEKKRKAIHAEQLGANDARTRGATRGVLATSNPACRDNLCISLLEEEFPNYRHANPYNADRMKALRLQTYYRGPEPPPTGGLGRAATTPETVSKKNSRGTSPESRATSDPSTSGSKATTNRTAAAPKVDAMRHVARQPQRTAIASPKIDLAKIRITVKNALRTGASLVKGLGKGLLIGAFIGLAIDWAWSKAMGWVFKGVDETTLKRLEKKWAPEIQRLMEKAIEDHIRRLARISGTTYKIVVDYRLVYALLPTNNFVLSEMLVDKAYVTAFGFEGCEEGNVSRDLKDTYYSKFSDADKLFRVLKCRKAIDFDYPDVGEPSIEGEWTEYYTDRGSEHPYARFRVGPPPVGGKAGWVSVWGERINAKQEMTIGKTEWTGHHLKFTTTERETIVEYFLFFKDWDTMSASLRVSNEYHVNADGTRGWERQSTIWRRRVEGFRGSGAGRSF